MPRIESTFPYPVTVAAYAMIWSLSAVTCARAQSVATPPAGSASAAASRDTTSAIQSVTITAQKRRENAQDVANATSVITEREIERAGINNIQDAAALTPNLVIIDQLRPGIQTVSFRGFTTVQGGQSPFAIVVDGVAQPGQEFLKQQFVDVQQIEVLRGPQGTLYGAGAIAGAINIVTAPPGNTVDTKIKLGFGRGGQHTGMFSVSGPIADNQAWYRLGVDHVDFGGLIRNETTHTMVDFSHETTLNGQLLWKPNARLSIDLHANGTEGRNGALWLVPVTNAGFDDWSGGPDTDIVGRDTRRLQTVSAKVDYSFEPFSLTSITAYNSARQFLFADGDFGPSPVAAQTWTNDSNSASQELRLTSADRGPLRWNVGAFVQRYRFVDRSQFGFLQPGGGIDFPSSSDSTTMTVNRSSALFGQAAYAFGTGHTLTVGLRQDRVLASGSDPGTGWSEAHTFSELQPKVTLAHQWTTDLMGYATYSKGFRTGGFNPNATGVARLYENEVSKNLELGVKSVWLNNRLVFNASVFRTRFDNQQFFYSLATSSGIIRAITNIPETSVNGAEFEFRLRPAAWIGLNGTLGYNDTSIDRFDQGQYDGHRTPQVYGLTSSVGVELQQAMGSGLAVARLDWNHRGNVYWDLANDLQTPPKNFFNARLAYEVASGAYEWQFALVGRNLTNERTPAAVGANALGPGKSLRSGNEPRQIGFEIQVRL